MAANPLPLLLLAGGAFLLAKGKGSSSTNGNETASPEKPSAEKKDEKGAPLFVLGKNCQPITPPANSAEREAYQKAVANYISKRAVEIYQQAMGGNPPIQRVNANLTPEQAEEAKAAYPEIEVKFSHITAPLEDKEDLWYSIYLELVPPECAKQTVWNSTNMDFEPPLFPSPAAACIGALIKVETARVLSAIGAEDFDYSPEVVTEILQACTGLDLALGGAGE